MILAVLATVAVFGALFVYGFPFVQSFGPLQRFTGSKLGMIAITGAFLLLVVYVTSHVLKVAKIRSAAAFIFAFLLLSSVLHPVLG